jgi:hypothetical protein
MKLCYADPEYRGQNLHLHDNLVFAQRMHIVLTGRNGHRLYPLSWEDRPVLDDNNQIIQWGRHRFTINPVEIRHPGLIYWQPSDKPRFEVFYYTD